MKITSGHHLTPVHCSNRHPLAPPIAYLKGGRLLLQALVLPNKINYCLCLYISIKYYTFMTIMTLMTKRCLINTSFIVAEVFVEELAAITAATAPRGNGELGVAAAMIG